VESHTSQCTGETPREEEEDEHREYVFCKHMSFVDSTDSRITFFAPLAKLLLPFAQCAFFTGGCIRGVIR